MTLKNDVGLVTGAGAGIGRAIALALSARGAKVMVSDVDEAGGIDTVRMIEQAGGTASFYKADVSLQPDVEGLVKATVERLGGLRFAVNNAGIEGAIAPLAECTVENFDRIIAINLRGAFLCMKYELGHMAKYGGGAVVNVASVAGLVGFSGLPAYVASKHALNGLTKNAALEYARQGIRVNCICPGGIRTRMLEKIATDLKSSIHDTFEPLHPMGRVGTPEEVASLTVWLLSEEASFVTGAIIPVDGGFVAQ